MHASEEGWRRASFQFWLLIALLVLAFFTGGSPRMDVQSLPVLRPATVAICGLALFLLRWHHVQAHKFAFIIFAATVALPILQLIPLPFVASRGHEIIAGIDIASGLEPMARPVSMAPIMTWNTLGALSVPLGVMLLIVQLDRQERFLLLPVLIGLGMFSGILGLLQAIGDPDGALYLYRLTNYGTAVGLFANRNHQALLLACLFPMLAAYASMGASSPDRIRYRNILLVLGSVVLVPLLLVTGSRAGLLLGVLGMLSAAILYRRQSVGRPKKRKPIAFDQPYLFATLGIVALIAVTILLSRAEAISRLTAPDQLDDLRWQIWKPIISVAVGFLPFGSGLGSFQFVYQVDQPLQTLTGNYVNQAHSDWIDVLFSSGIPGLVIASICLLALLKTAIVVFSDAGGSRRSIIFSRLGLILLILLGAASAVDYPLRTPILGVLMVVAVSWSSMIYDLGKKSAGSI